MRVYTKKELDFLVEKYPKYGGEYCSQHLKRTRNSIQKKVYELGLKLDKNLHSKIKQKNSLKWYEKVEDEFYNVGINQFKNIKTPEISYILGLLWADGYIMSKGSYQRIILEMIRTDLDKLKFVFERTGDWTCHYRKRMNKQESCILKTSNRPLVSYFKDMDFDKKSFISPDNLLKKIPEKIKKYFFRGIIDGDGCFYINGNQKYLSIGGTYEQDWSYIEKLFKDLNVKYTIWKKENENIDGNITRSSIIEVATLSGIKLFGEYLYENYEVDNIGLRRKYEKYLHIINKEYQQNKLKI